MDQTEKNTVGFGDQSLRCDHIQPGVWVSKKSTLQPTLVYWIAALPAILSVSVLIGSSVVLFGYYFGAEILYRPISGGPATHPSTATLCFLLGTAIIALRGGGIFLAVKKVLVFIVLSVVTFSLVDYLFATELLPETLIFGNAVTADLGAGLSNYLSINTDVMLFLIAGALLAESFKKYGLSQLLAFVSIGIPCISFIGYVYGISFFYSHMSLYTALLGFMLGWAVLASTSEKAVFKAVLSPHAGGKVVRIQVIAGMLLPFFVGLILAPYSGQLSLALIAIFVILLTWILVLVSSITAIVQDKIERARHQTTAQLIKNATTDPLTGLLNRRQFIEVTEAEHCKAQRNERNLALLMIDVDDFKSINDAAGHAVGDRALVKIAEAISSCVRETDLVCRFGGEEFTVLLFDSTDQGVKRVCKKILKAVADIEIDQWTEHYGPITVSIGSSLLTCSSDFECSLKLADKAMYQSKQMGKNQAVCLH